MKDLTIEKDKDLRIVLNRDGDKVNFIELSGYKTKGERQFFESIVIELTRGEVEKIKRFFSEK